jgi:hypothetical protein
MKAKSEIHAVALVREIRDRMAGELAGKTDAEIIAFFRRAGAAARKKRKGNARRGRGRPRE